MTQHRFFVAPALLERTPIPLEGDLAHQLCRVLRLAPGDEIELLDNSGRAWRVRLEQVRPTLCLATPLYSYLPETEPTIPMILYQGIAKGRKLDWVIQKATELGAQAIIPMVTARSILSDPGELGAAKRERLQRIAQEAAEQAGRARIPLVHPPVPFSQALEEIGPQDLALFGSPGGQPLRQVLERVKTLPGAVRIYIGPEGGFETHEVRQAEAHKAVPVHLGPRILRTETAGMILLALVAYALGEMDRGASQ